MKIIVCIKQVPDTTDVKIDPKTNTLVREGVESIINPFDMYAIEEGLRIREKIGGSVTVVSMGPPQAEEALKEAISFGADEAYLISDRAFAGSDTLATSYTLSCAIKKINPFDLILCGKQAIDGDTAQVGPGIAVWLDIPQITFVKRIEEIKEGYIKAERMVEEGYEVIESQLPCLITVVKEINEPRLPSLKGKLRAKKYIVKKLTTNDLSSDPDKIGLKGSPTQVIKIFTPPVRTGGITLHGLTTEIVEKLAALLKDGVQFK
ncbi:MAG: electron transfer flavoprotein subunit beta/FixA family protein [Candidatus Omnitrophota bacterium]